MPISDYLVKLPEDRQKVIQELRKLLKITHPNVQESMKYKMSTYALEERLLCAFASQKQCFALYIMPHDLLGDFEGELEAYNCGKSCIRFKSLHDEDLELFQRILEYTGKHLSKSQFWEKLKV